MKSNITIAPNIYVRTGSIVNVASDEAFIRQVYGHKALNILKSRLPKSAATFTRPQIEEMRQNVTCRLGKNREHAYGKVLLDGSVAWSCRCEHTACHNYDKCMELPNALRIDRDEVREIAAQPDSGVEAAGFDHEDANFEPPHVAIILPILTEILVGKEDEASLKQTISEINRPPADVCSVTAEEFREVNDRRVLVICENAYEVGYFSTILYRNNVPHRIAGSQGYTLNRRIADMFWDFHGGEIDREAFLMRYCVRVFHGEDADEAEAIEFYEALYAICGIEGSDALRINGLADALNRNPDLIGECMLNMDDPYCPVTLSTLEELSPDEEYDEIMLLGGAKSEAAKSDGFDLFGAVTEIFGSPPTIVKKDSASGWMFTKSVLGRPCRVGLDSYKGEAGRYCLNVELGLPGDVDGKSFLTEQMGDAIRLQLYIAERIAEGDELTVEKNSDTGGYWFCHEGNILGEFPAATIREVCSIEGFPDDFVGFEGVYVRNIVTLVSAQNDPTVPPRFRETGIWLGLDITGYAKVRLA